MSIADRNCTFSHLVNDFYKSAVLRNQYGLKLGNSSVYCALEIDVRDIFHSFIRRYMMRHATQTSTASQRYSP